MRDEKIKQTLSKRFADFGSEPSEKVWDTLELHLNNEDRNSGTGKSAFMWWSIAFIGLTFASWGIFSNATRNDSAQLEIVETKIENAESTGDASPVKDNSALNSNQTHSNNDVQLTEQLNASVNDRRNKNSSPKFSKEVASVSIIDGRTQTDSQDNTGLDRLNKIRELNTLTTFNYKERPPVLNALDDQTIEKASVKPDPEFLASGNDSKDKANQTDQTQSPKIVSENPKSTIETTDFTYAEENVTDIETAPELSTAMVKELPHELDSKLSDFRQPSTFKWRPPNWEMRVKFSTFKNIGSTSRPDSYLSPFNWQPISEPAPLAYTQNYKRYGEFQIDVSRRIGRKFYISAGLSTSYSRNKAGTPDGDSLFSLSQMAFGIPVEIGFTLVNYKRFSIKPYLGILNEFNSYLQNVTINSGNSIGEGDSGYSLESGYSLGLQPSVEFSYYMNENTRLSLSCGYRKFIAGKTNGYSPGLNQPDYFQTAIGLSWILRKK